MPKRTSPKDARFVEVGDDLNDVVKDKRAGWRATAAKGRRRQRRYQKRLLEEIEHLVQDGNLQNIDFEP